MLTLDQRLLYQANQLTTGANVHRVKELMLAYEYAVTLHNDGIHQVYLAQFERELREFVYRERTRNQSRLIEVFATPEA
jgi:hypothetical protein